MKRLINTYPVFVLAVLLAVMVVVPAVGQDGGQRGDREGDRRGERRERMDWDNMSEEQQKQMRERFEQRFEEMRREQAQRMRERLELSEEEYEAIEPMIDQVNQLARESMSAGRNMFGGRDRGRGGPGGDRGRGSNPFGDQDNMSPQGKTLTEASEALRETLENTDASSDEVKSRLAALRKARASMQDALRQAREELREFVTPRQEATLVLQGTLD